MAEKESAAVAEGAGDTGGIACSAHGLAAGRKYMNARCLREDSFRQDCDGLNQMLAVVEHEQGLLILKQDNQLSKRILGEGLEFECRGNCGGDQLRIYERGQIDEMGTILVGLV